MDEKLLEPDLDVDELIGHMGNNRELALRLAGKFPQDRAFQEFVEAYGRKDYQAAYIYAHQIKGLAANLCMKGLCVLMTQFLRALDEGDYEEAAALAEKAKGQYERTCEAVGKFIGSE